MAHVRRVRQPLRLITVGDSLDASLPTGSRPSATGPQPSATSPTGRASLAAQPSPRRTGHVTARPVGRGGRFGHDVSGRPCRAWSTFGEDVSGTTFRGGGEGMEERSGRVVLARRKVPAGGVGGGANIGRARIAGIRLSPAPTRSTLNAAPTP